MRFYPAFDEVPDAQRLTISGVEMVAFSDGTRAHIVAADVFDVFFRPEVDPAAAVTPAPKKATKAAREWNAYAKKKNAKHAPAVQAAQSEAKPKAAPIASSEPDLNGQIVAALKVKPLEFTELLEHFRVEGQKPAAAFYARMKALENKGLIVAPPKGSGAAWRAAA